MIKKSIALLIGLCSSFILLAQESSDQWARQIEGSGDHAAYAVARTSANELYVTGKIQGTGTLDDGTLLETITPTRTELFLVKYNPDGERIWSKNFSALSQNGCLPTCNGPIIGWGLAVDPMDESLFVCGQLKGGVDFNENGQAENISDGSVDGFITKFTPDGQDGGVRIFIGGVANQVGDDAVVRKVAIDQNGNILAAGTFMDQAHIISTFGQLPFLLQGDADNSMDIWVAKFSPEAEVLWYKTIKGAGPDRLIDMTLDPSGNPILVGSYEQNLLPEDGTELPFANSLRSGLFVIKYSNSGAFVWENAVGTTVGSPAFGVVSNGTGNEANAITTDDQGNVFVTGAFTGTVTFDTNNQMNYIFNSAGQKDVFVAKYSPLGLLVWARQANGPGLNTGDVISFKADTVIVGGRFGRVIGGSSFSTIEFDPDLDPEEAMLTSKGREDIFLASYDPEDGSFLQVRQFGGNHDDRAFDLINWEDGESLVGEFESDTLIIGQDTLANMDGGINAYFSGVVNADTALMVHVRHMLPSNPDKAVEVEVWSLDDQSVIKEINEDDVALFSRSDLRDMDVYEAYLLREDETVIGKIHLSCFNKNRMENRQKEVIIMLHNDLSTYGDHPIDGTNENWEWMISRKYDFKAKGPGAFAPVDPMAPNFYPANLLIPPVNDDLSYLLDSINKEITPVLFVHGYTDIDPTWGTDTQILPEDITILDDNYKGDYPITSTPSRLRRLSRDDDDKPTLDSWEFYYPPEQAWDESSFLLGRAIQEVLSHYDTDKAHLVGFSMGGLVSGGYLSGIAKAYFPGSTAPQYLPYAGNVERALILASPQHGSFLGNRAFYRIYLPEILNTAVAGKNSYSPGLREAAVGSRFVTELMQKRQDPAFSPGNGQVDYLCVVGSRDDVAAFGNPLQLDPSLLQSFAEVLAESLPVTSPVAFLAFLLSEAEFNLTPLQESAFNSDQVVSISSGSLLNYGIDLGVMEAYGHGTFARGIAELPATRRENIAKIANDFLPDGELLPPNQNLFLEFISGDDPTNMNPVPTLNLSGEPEDLVRLDVVMPMVTFKNSDGSFWQPKLVNGNGGVGFRFETEIDTLSPGLVKGRLTFLEGLDGNFSYVANRGLYLYYGANNFSPNDFKISLMAGENPAYQPPATFYPYEKPFFNLPFPDYNPRNPLAIKPETAPGILSNGAGWHMPDTAQLDLDLTLYYSLPRFSSDLIVNTMIDIAYSNLTKGIEEPEGKLNLRWSQATYNEFVIDEWTRNIMEINQVIDQNLASQPDGGAPDSEATNWVDENTDQASFVLCYDEGTSPPEITLESPSGQIISPNDAGPDVVYQDDPDLGIRGFSIGAPEVGQWQILFNGNPQPPANVNVNYPMSVNNRLVINILADSLVNDSAFIVQATLENSAIPTQGLQVLAYYYNALDSIFALPLADDGQGFDEVAGDGIFTGLFYRPDANAYDLVIGMWGEMVSSTFIRQAMASVPACDLDIRFEADDVCLGDTTFFNTEVDALNIRSFSWDFGDGTSAGSYDPFHVYDSAGTYEVVFRATTTTGCIDTVHRSITVYPSGNFDLIPSTTDPLCPGDNLLLDAGDGFSTYTWNTGADSQSIIVTEAGDYFVSVESPLGCTALSDTVTVQVAQAPVISFNEPDGTIICPGSSLSISPGDGFASYTWSDGSDDSMLVVSEAGTYTVTVTNTAGCSSEGELSIEVAETPDLQILNLETSYFVTSTDITLIGQPSGGSFSGPGISGNTFSPAQAGEGVHLIEYSYTDTNGCTFNTTQTVTVTATPGLSVSGTVTTSQGLPVPDVLVTTASGVSVLTDATGAYTFPDLPAGQDYIITPSKATDPLEGVNTLDLIELSRHFLGFAPLDSPYKFIAADVDFSNFITLTDLQLIRQLILSQITAFPTGDSWRFIPEGYSFFDPDYPFVPALPGSVTVPNLTTPVSNRNFTGIKLGDINGDAITTMTSQLIQTHDAPLLINIPDEQLKPGVTQVFPVRLNTSESLLGLQAALAYDPAKLEIDAILPGVLTDIHSHTLEQDGQRQTRLLWAEPEALAIGAGDILFYLRVTPKQNFTLSEVLTFEQIHFPAKVHSLVPSQPVEVYPLLLDFTATDPRLEVQVFPNPTSGSFQVHWFMDTPGSVSVQAFDALGQPVEMLWSERMMEKGWQWMERDATAWPKGVYWIEVRTGQHRTMQRLIKP